MPVGELLTTIHESEELCVSSATVKRASEDVLMQLARTKKTTTLCRDELIEIASRSDVTSVPSLTMMRMLQYLEEETPILKCGEHEIGFTHAMFRDVLVAKHVARRLTAGSADSAVLGAEMGRYVAELLEGEDQPIHEPDEVPEGMAYVPPGPFIAGEGPDTRITSLSEGFFIGKCQVTNYEFEAFMEPGGYEDVKWWSLAGLNLRRQRDWKGPQSLAQEGLNAPEQPVVGISCFEAEAYCAWLSQRTGHTIRLPTSLEWEKAARGVDGRDYPWGNEEAFSRAATDEYAAFSKDAVDEQGLEQTLGVGHFSPEGDSPYGLADMTGNAWDWVTVDARKRAVRGGSFAEPLSEARSANVRPMDPKDRSNDLGFRVVQELSNDDTAPSE
jgi:formylglycine-generating enzyme required for sulfatase activity